MKIQRLVLAIVMTELFMILAPIAPSEAGGPERKALSGSLHVIWEDPLPGSGGQPRMLSFLIEDKGGWIEMEIDETLAAQYGGILGLNRKKVRVQGDVVEASRRALRVLTIEIEVQGGSSAPGNSSITAASNPFHRTGSLPWVTILCRFADSPGITPHDVPWFETLMGNAKPGMDHYWREQSYESMNLTGSVVVGWYTLPYTRSYYGTGNANLGALLNDCTEAADADVVFTDFAGINLMFNDGLGCCAWGGGGSLFRDGQNKDYMVTWMPPWGYESHWVLGQEMGHGLGLMHSSGPYNQTYDSKWDMMSSGGVCRNPDPNYGCLGDHTISYHKDKLGWIPTERKYTAPLVYTRTITLERLALPLSSTDYLMGEIPIEGDAIYTVEVRRFAGYDTEIPGEAVVIHKVFPGAGDRAAQVVDVDGNGDPNDDGAMWTVGETFTDPGVKIRVSIDAITPTGYAVTIQRGDPVTNPPDLIVASVSGPLEGTTGQYIDLPYTVTNQGTGSVVGPVYSVAGFYLSTDTLITTKDIFVGSYNVPSLGSQQSASGTALLRIPAMPMGRYYVGMIADYNDQVQESDETNNAALGNEIVIVSPDLTLAQVSGPVSATHDSTINISYTLVNQGQGAADGPGGAWVMGFYLSTDENITTNDIFLLPGVLTSDLGPGSSRVEGYPVTVGADVVPGIYYLGVIADTTNTVPESNEGNNARAGNLINIASPTSSLIVYGEGTVKGGVTTPRYRTRSGLDWSSTEMSALSIGATVRWSVLKSNPVRTEALLGTLDDLNDVNLQVWNGSAWGNLIEVTTSASTSEARALDIAYEQLSGRGLIVYNDGTLAPKYRIWNGASWSSQGAVPVTRTTGAPVWVRLEAKPGSNEILLTYQDANADVNALVWNGGSAWGNEQLMETAVGASRVVAQGFDIAYEHQSGRAMVAWGRLGSSAVSGGHTHTCALLLDGRVMCWGENTSGQLGSGTFIGSATPNQVNGTISAVEISSGSSHTCALLLGGSVTCWGWNGSGQLGNGGTADTPSPVAVGGITNAIAVATGHAHSCALLSNGSVKCWGDNTFGQLGNGTTTGSTVPVAVNGIATAVLLKAGHSHTCALLQEGTIKCWGRNSSGQLGNRSTSNSSLPVSVSGITTAVTMSAASSHTCSVLVDGTGRCWGGNSFGQLGNGATKNASSPATVSGLSGATAIETGFSHTCALLSEGTLKCWGSNSSGQLGNGGTANALTPALVSGIGSAVSLSAGAHHSCALLLDGTLNCWGWNGSGQLGNGGYNSASVPLTVQGISSASKSLRYRVWSGTGWSGENPYGNAAQSAYSSYFVRVVADPLSNRLVLGMTDPNFDLSALVWEGNGWGPGVRLTGNLEFNATEREFDLAWETTAGEILAVYDNKAVSGINSPGFYRTWMVGSGWSGEVSLPAGAEDPVWVQLRADSNSNEIFVGILDKTLDVNLHRWNGLIWGNSLEVETSSSGGVYLYESCVIAYQ